MSASVWGSALDRLDRVEAIAFNDALLDDSEFEDYDAIFMRCSSCDGVINSSVFPVCDDCMIRKGPFRRWCCATEDHRVPAFTLPVSWSMCPWNLAYLGRYDTVFQRRALAA